MDAQPWQGPQPLLLRGVSGHSYSPPLLHCSHLWNLLNIVWHLHQPSKGHRLFYLGQKKLASSRWALAAEPLSTTSPALTCRLPQYSRTSPHSTYSTSHSSVLGTESQASLCQWEVPLDAWNAEVKQKPCYSPEVVAGRCGGRGSPPGSFQRALESHRLGCSRLRWWWSFCKILQNCCCLWKTFENHRLFMEYLEGLCFMDWTL